MTEVHSPQGIRQSEQHFSPVLESATREVFEMMLDSKLQPLSPVETMELLLDKLGKTRSNGEFLGAMSG